MRLAPYGDGEQHIQYSLEQIAQRTREGYDTAVMKSFAGNVLKQYGFPKTEFAQMSAILDFVRKNVGYRADAPMREQIQTAAVSLCVDGAPVCIPIGDCDDLVTCVATLLMAAGFHVRIVRQIFADGVQQHVLVEAYDTQQSEWVPLDPSSDMPAGDKVRAKTETTLDPLEGMPQKFVGIGALPVVVRDGAGWRRVPPSVGLGRFANARVQQAVRGGLPGMHYTPQRVGFGALCDVDSVLAYKRRLAAPWASLITDVNDCPRITLDQKTAFKLDSISFNNWFTGKMPELPFCGADQLIREGQDFESRLTAWRRLLLTLGCPPTAPELPPLSDSDPKSINYKVPVSPESDTLRTVKAVGTAAAIVGGVVATIYGLTIAAPIISLAVSGIGRKRSTT